MALMQGRGCWKGPHVGEGLLERPSCRGGAAGKTLVQGGGFPRERPTHRWGFKTERPEDV